MNGMEDQNSLNSSLWPCLWWWRLESEMEFSFMLKIWDSLAVDIFYVTSKFSVRAAILSESSFNRIFCRFLGFFFVFIHILFVEFSSVFYLDHVQTKFRRNGKNSQKRKIDRIFSETITSFHYFHFHFQTFSLWIPLHKKLDEEFSLRNRPPHVLITFGK